MPVIDVKHPLVKHKVGLLREDDISTKKFRELTNELARLLAYEATADFPLEKTTIQCWSGPVEIDQIAGRKVTIVPILRAGLGMLDGVLDMVPNAKISVVGLARDHETLQPVHYFERFVGHLSERTAIIVDPMLATAGSMIATIDLLKAKGCKDIRALVLVAAPEGVAALDKAHPDVRCWTAAVDSPEPSVIFARASSRERPPALRAARTSGIATPNTDRSPANLTMFAGVRTKGITSLSPGTLFDMFWTACPATPNSFWNV